MNEYFYSEKKEDIRGKKEDIAMSNYLPACVKISSMEILLCHT